MMAFCGREVQALITSVLPKWSFPVPCYAKVLFTLLLLNLILFGKETDCVFHGLCI